MNSLPEVVKARQIRWQHIFPFLIKWNIVYGIFFLFYITNIILFSTNGKQNYCYLNNLTAGLSCLKSPVIFLYVYSNVNFVNGCQGSMYWSPLNHLCRFVITSKMFLIHFLLNVSYFDWTRIFPVAKLGKELLCT